MQSGSETPYAFMRFPMTSPSDALKLVEGYQGNIDLLVTDVVMPEMNGRELAEKIMEIKPDIKCLFMSGYATDMIQQTGVRFLKETHFTETFLNP